MSERDKMILDNAPLARLLEQIDSDTNMKERYQSIWMSIVHFLYNNSGLKISRIAQAGSRAKQTDIKGSDLDVVFSVSPNQSREQIYPGLVEKLRKNFPNTRVNIGDLTIHVEFTTHLSVDVVLRDDYQFTYQHQEIVDIRQLDSTNLKAIKLIKFAVDAVGLANKYPSYTIEEAIWGIRGMALELHNLIEMNVCEMTTSICHRFPYVLSSDAKQIFTKLGGNPVFLR